MTHTRTFDTRIDGHVHVWNRSTDPQPWIDQDTMGPIDRDFSMDDLSSVLDSTAFDAAIVVQSTNSFAETQRLLAGATSRVAGVVGWVDLSAGVAHQLASLSSPDRDRLVGVRHLVHIDPDPAWLGRPDVGNGLSELGELGLTFDLVVRWWQLPLVRSVVARHREVQFVLDHLGGPPFGSPDVATWEASMRELAACPNVAVKLSGVPAPAGAGTVIIDLCRPVIAATIAAFGGDRLLYGSDWPLVELAGGPTGWRDAVDESLAGLPPEDRVAIFGGTAQRVYGLGREAA